MRCFYTIIIVLFPLQLQADFSGNIHLTDNYIYRGITNSAHRPAIQTGIDYSNENGIYAGIWASTMDFELPHGQPSYEFDVYGGIIGKSSTLNWDIGFLYFTYPNGASKWELDAHEFYLGFSRDINAMNVATIYHYSPNYSGAGNSHYIEVNADIPLPHDFNLSFHGGQQWFENNEWYGLPDYKDFRIAVSHEIAGFFVEIGWTDTNIKNRNACFFGTDWCKNKFSIEIHKDFSLF